MVHGHKFKRNDDDTPVPLGRKSIQAYIKIITDIYYKQVALDLNKNPHFRGPIVRQFLDTNTKKETKHKRVNQYFLEQNSTVRVRNRLCFLMSHAMFFRSETALGTQYPDLFKMELKDQGTLTLNKFTYITKKKILRKSTHCCFYLFFHSSSQSNLFMSPKIIKQSRKKSPKLSGYMKGKIVDTYDFGISMTKIVCKYELPYTTVIATIERVKKTGTALTKKT
ncbi:hypothetical protein PHYBLDRAFT_71013 [Phycomyces blakesleeanus NRRL 1555(-)]|uniref:Homeodomain-like DNA binding domain-containing transcription factor n=1 Tax=Phycomyces blakesleeanus (strain ATCC 8743b / DSM 1359 / FGSC 10004 / NBRC 33097 / NRRL 1555) TaxID=763407 RepID=A0A167J6U1_PHYB8|nr:hypothetical protein PHYBLDRAFT_71013 [Phycomyces blakesleeanus NRRL 1555(-)]OAD65317.1 hypothetical protein PHYBLDRAFT_71013 [Phycomyces blakesleeanus NRRL 1555(-)]|eukprot:XP_018283357.1 hypothetical protein PHYBLDRAFT_71013 [Phycomyces blakesleeanus NRRL 1555(-)]